MAEREGFEPPCRLPDKTLSRRRFDHSARGKAARCALRPPSRGAGGLTCQNGDATRKRPALGGPSKDGGEGGIRTPVPVTRQDAFEAPPLRPLRYLSVYHYARGTAARCALGPPLRGGPLRPSLAAAGALTHYACGTAARHYARGTAARCALGPPLRGGPLRPSPLYSNCCRRAAKNSWISSRHSVSSTPPVAVIR